MKSAIVKSSMLSAAVLFCLSSQAMALPTAGQQVVVTEGAYGTTTGGEFNLDVGKNGSIDYIGFCLEQNEHVTMGATYVIDSVADYANAGGVGGAVNGQDALSDATKWVYWNYMTGNLGAKTNALTDAVQNVIWYLEGEIAFNSSFGSYYNSWVTGQSDYSISGVVKVLNLESTDGALAQSMIIGEPGSTPSPVPEPNTMLLFGAGMAGLAGVARRRKSN